MRYQSLGEMFFDKRQSMPDKVGYMFKEGGKWRNVTFKEAVDWAERISAGFASFGIKKGDRVALISPNRIEWALCDYAAMALGALLVPIYPSLLSEQIGYILKDSEAKILIIADELQLQKVDEIRSELNLIKGFFVLDPPEKLEEPWQKFDALTDKGKAFLEKNPDYVTDEIKKVKPCDWATIIYTSGTTGEPKGAVLTHGNFLSNVEGSLSILDVYSEDQFLSFLPLSHIFERMAGHFLSNYQGSAVAYAESIDTVPENMLEIRPTIMISVPRLYEKIYSRVMESVEMGSPVKRKIFYWAVGVGKKYVNRIMKKQPIPLPLSVQYKLASKLVFHKMQDRFGGRIRFFVSGGAPLSAEIAEFFTAAGLIILEGYGLTETSPVISVNLLDNFKFGTVGPPIPNVEVKIADDGEILTRGPHIMVGYFKKEAETKESIDDEGWFHTGDIGLLDEDGFLKITDRKKNIIVTSGGKNIAPQPIENALATTQYIEQAVVIGDKRKYCTAIIVPAFESVKNWAAEQGKTIDSYGDMLKLDGLKELIRKEIDKVNAGLARYETIKDFIFAREPFSIESGELTPSLKVKRRVVEDEYHDEIEEMYKL
ncbi:MAG: long-chain fatty acid--CoA ligase [Calditrichaeota bacterium]|nr:long-chain fatty acid--CoA ligase [Calditrichota bacterium]